MVRYKGRGEKNHHHHHYPFQSMISSQNLNVLLDFLILGSLDAEMYLEQEKMGQMCRKFFGTYRSNRGAVSWLLGSEALRRAREPLTI